MQYVLVCHKTSWIIIIFFRKWILCVVYQENGSGIGKYMLAYAYMSLSSTFIEKVVLCTKDCDCLWKDCPIKLSCNNKISISFVLGLIWTNGNYLKVYIE